MFRVVFHIRQRHLMRAEGALDLQPVHNFGTGPSLERAHHDRGPSGTLPQPISARIFLNLLDRRVASFQGRGHLLMNRHWFVALDEKNLVTVPAQKLPHLIVSLAREDGGTGNLVAIEMQDRQHRAIARGIEEVDSLPRSFEWSGLRLAITDYARDDKLGVVECRAERMHERIAELTALVNGTWNMRTGMTRNSTRGGKLAEENS